MDLDTLLTGLKQRRGSDLYLTADSPPLYRVDGATVAVEDRVWLAGEVESVIRAVLSPAESDEFDRTHELNLARALSGVGRFRLNVFRQRGQMGLVARLIPIDFPNAETLGLPASLIDLIMQKRGLILVTGATGSGKSTTLAALIDDRNIHTRGHILTIEDPIEFVHPHKGCVVTQREVGVDTVSFEAGLKSALRQAPDVILIGEMRDLATVEAAIHFAETGHLVLGTLHANNANQAVERVMNFFSVEAHAQIYQQLALNLRGIVSQRLLPRASGTGRVAAIEVMLNAPRIADLIAKAEIAALKEAIEANAQDGSRSFDQALYDLYRGGLITLDEALRQADSANNLRIRIKLESATMHERGAAAILAHARLVRQRRNDGRLEANLVG
ncbi:MAG: PilT/PilU family type 4a pilus ATPase [Candidatus Eisenbacteria bacterium]|uniref:PilT/PilU family type 4a pilus ATPase n=1 Tax=Eiseniibacteriota bacterium TaxID=2212470 RepID=A0A538SI57_UNCEI|nr:MAG: PilT/PilU family type 4a pilus ATPase [Candidatus Eisenbacteria bacterium]